eukprot:SAG11_NODE_775_length_7226_cov_2.988214_1_plen_103_part_00
MFSSERSHYDKAYGKSCRAVTTTTAAADLDRPTRETPPFTHTNMFGLPLYIITQDRQNVLMCIISLSRLTNLYMGARTPRYLAGLSATRQNEQSSATMVACN